LPGLRGLFPGFEELWGDNFAVHKLDVDGDAFPLSHGGGAGNHRHLDTGGIGGFSQNGLDFRQGHAGFDFLEVVPVHLGARAGHETYLNGLRRRWPVTQGEQGHRQGRLCD